MFRRMFQRFIIFSTVLLASIFCAQTAFSKTCEGLDKNEKYTSLVQKMNHHLKAESYEKALKTIHQLLEICPSLPSSNYVAGKIYQKLNDNEKASEYYRKATENTKNYIVDNEMTKSMWYARYEAEHPEMMACKTETLDTFYQQPLYDYAETIMWTGTGVGAAGIVFAIVGGAMMGTEENGMVDDILLGVGIGATVAGAVMAGLGGYQYTKLKSEKEAKESKEKVDVALNVFYNHIGLSMRF